MEERHAKPGSPHNEAAAAAAAGSGKGKVAGSKRKAKAEPEEEAEEEGEGTTAAEGEEEAEEEGEEAAPEYEPSCVVAFEFGSADWAGEPPSFQLIRDSFGGKDGGVRFVDYTAGGRGGGARGPTASASIRAPLPQRAPSARASAARHVLPPWPRRRGQRPGALWHGGAGGGCAEAGRGLGGGRHACRLRR